ncbi:MAG: hypothetical protein HN909_05120 [Phycisphaerales bacterium]|jgi:GH35 family endo-1,4-beta-xylanase|nr:hypothetical protein [Phycisphaerales bacterium]MBT7171133.1 hypothetical protein [Phycisphaerales bacterium]
MLRFETFQEGEKRTDFNLNGAYLFGFENVPIQADIVSCGKQLSCMKAAAGPAGLKVVHPTGKSGTLLLGTTRLPESPKPYILDVELLRNQIAQFFRKREEWSLFDLDNPQAEAINEEFRILMHSFGEVLALTLTDRPAAAKKAQALLDTALELTEKATLLHADLLWQKRCALKLETPQFGVRIEPSIRPSMVRPLLGDVDAIYIPMTWRQCEPKERVHSTGETDEWINYASREKKTVIAGPLIGFAPEDTPKWLEVWKGDIETLKRLCYAHIQRLVERYSEKVDWWIISSGLEVNHYQLPFEELIELLQQSCALVHRLDPDAKIMLNLPIAWGEYSARNARSIPARQIVDLIAQGAELKVDGIGIELALGMPTDGHFIRDLGQIASLFDTLQAAGKPIHVTAFGIPSSNEPDTSDLWKGRMPITPAGQWHQPHSAARQADWLASVVRIARSRFAVETLTWGRLADVSHGRIPHGGLTDAHLQTKAAYHEFLGIAEATRTHQTIPLPATPSAPDASAPPAETS